MQLRSRFGGTLVDMTQKIVNAVALTILAGATYVGFELVQSQQAAEKYRRQWEEVSKELDDMQNTYNDVVRRTAVTELHVKNGRLSAVIRTAEGELKRIETPYDPNNEIFVDYIVLDGRIWIRRVFDDKTAPDKGIIINPSLASIDWDADRVHHGKAVYRRLGEGRWTVTVTGNGSLGLARASETTSMPLAAPPVIREADEIK